MPNSSAHGRFVWHDLDTTDPAGAIAFYSEIAHWGTEKWEGATDYTMWTREGKPIGGLSPLIAGGGREPAPRWLPYVYVYDVDETIRQATSLGARVEVAPTEVVDVGDWAVITDPQGASIGVFESAGPPPGHDGEPRVGEFSWHELATDDGAAAVGFYRALFRWESMSEFDMGEMGVYHVFGQRGHRYGGIFTRRGQTAPPRWLSYIRVAGVGAAAERISQIGGTVQSGPMEVPSGEWIAQFLDPQGAPSAVHGER